MNSVMDYTENSKRFRRKKYLEEQEQEDENEWFDEGFGGEGSLTFDQGDGGEDVTEYDENNLIPTCFSKWFDAKIASGRKIIPIPLQLPKENKKKIPSHPLKWAEFTNEEEIENTMVVIGKIPNTKRKISENNGTKKKRNYAFTAKKTQHKKPGLQVQNQFCFSITKGIECPHYSCTYIHHYSQIETCKYNDQCRFAFKVDDELYIRNNNGRCTKRHVFECIESYLLRLEIKIYNCTFLVLKINPEIHTDSNILKQVLESAKNCRVSSLIWLKKKITIKEEVTLDSEFENNDDEWITPTIPIFNTVKYLTKH
jgi:hypothetical protein